MRRSYLASYATIAGLLKLSEVGAQDERAAVEAVKRWLGSNQVWLLILASADDLVMARAFLPSGKKGHVILNTRAQAEGIVTQVDGLPLALDQAAATPRRQAVGYLNLCRSHAAELLRRRGALSPDHSDPGNGFFPRQTLARN